MTGVPGSQVKRVAMIMANNRPGTLVWCMGGTQHTSGNNNTRAYCVLQLALGNVGVSGGGTNIFRGHDNVQGATDLGNLPDNLPGYYGLSEGAWKHWARVWDVPYDDLLARFGSKELMEAPGIPESRWFDGVLEAKENLDQPSNIHALIYMGHAPNSQSPPAGPQEGDGAARPPGRDRSLSDRLGGAPRPQGQRLPAAGLDPVRDLRLGDRLQPLGAVAREGVRPAVRVQARPHGPLPARRQARLRRADVQAHPGRRRGAGGRGHHPGVQPRHLDDRLHRRSRPSASSCTWPTSTPSTRPRCRRSAARATANTTACPGRAGARPR